MGGAAEVEVLVDPREYVCRLCFSANIPISIHHDGHPNQVDPATNLIRLEEIGWRDVNERGFSVQRRRLYSRKEALAEAARREAAKNEKFGGDVTYRLAGALIAKVSRINSISDDTGNPIFRVLETPTEDQPGHAEIRIAAGLKKHHLLKYRAKLQAALGTLKDSEELDAE